MRFLALIAFGTLMSLQVLTLLILLCLAACGGSADDERLRHASCDPTAHLHGAVVSMRLSARSCGTAHPPPDQSRGWIPGRTRVAIDPT